MDCEHQFEKFVIGKPNSTGLDRAAYRQICWICGRTETEVHLITQLLEAQAEIERLEKVRDAVIKCDDYGLLYAEDAYDQAMVNDLLEKLAEVKNR
jgi:transcription termination factor NusB